jgi:hypothetical protein
MLWNLSNLALFCNYVHKIMLRFYVCFCIFLTLMWYVAFLCLSSCLCYATLLQAGLLEVPVTYLGSLSYFSSWGNMLPDGLP